MRRILALICLCFPSLAGAAEWNIRPWDTRLSDSELRTIIDGQAIAFPDGAVARYETGGTYSYTYNGGNSFEGTWSFAEDGSVCTTFTSGQSRCDLYVMQGDRLMLINEAGGRFLTAR